MSLPPNAPPRLCPACHTENLPSSMFCYHCGRPLLEPPRRGGTTQTPVPTPVPTPSPYRGPEPAPPSARPPSRPNLDVRSLLIAPAGLPADSGPPGTEPPGYHTRPAPSGRTYLPGQPAPYAPPPPPPPFPVPPQPFGWPPPEPPFRQGTQWHLGDLIEGRYLVRRKIESGMGVVYLCFDQQANEPVAIKTYLDDIAANKAGSASQLAQLFESEALLWIRLGRHPHVVQARYVLRIGGKPHIFLEYVRGTTGGESTVRRLLQHGGVDIPTALLLAIQICAGMEHATRIFPGLVHRDLKPENLLLTQDGVLKVTDFGLTKVFSDFSGEVGVVAGTPPYMSPEQALGLPGLDSRSDIYAVGIILYELLTGRRPFTATDLVGLLRAHLVEAPEPPGRHVAGLPDAVEKLVLTCLEKSPEARFQDFATLRTELTACYQAVTDEPPALPDADGATEEPSEALAAVELARAISLVTLGRYDDAMPFFDAAVEHDPALARAWYYRGLALSGLGRHEEALDCLERVVTLDPRDPVAWVERGRALTRAARREDALECFERALNVDPWHLAGLYEKGSCLLFLGRYAEALECIDEVGRLQPGPAVEAARQACRAAQEQRVSPYEPSWQPGEEWRDAGNSAEPAPLRPGATRPGSLPDDGLDLRT